MDTTMQAWLSQYETIINARRNSGEIAEKTAGDYRRLMNFCYEIWRDRTLLSLSVSEITAAIHNKAAVTPHAARRLRINLSNLFIEAQRSGVVPHGYNPALLSRWPATYVSTERLTLDEWLKVYRCATYRAPEYFHVAMLLSLITAQRRGDIVKMHRDDVRDGFLYVIQEKTGERIAIPLALRLAAVGCSVEDILSFCSPTGWLIRCRGDRVNPWSLTRWFQICRDDAGILASPGRTPPTFREQRSLSERLYRQEGIDTKTLLGHKYQRMTDQYNDIRGKEYRIVTI